MNEGTVYLIHFDQPYRHARHYVGFAHHGCFEQRIKHHRNGNGARLMKVVTDAGIAWSVVRTWENVTKKFERQLKRTHKVASYCPACRELRAADSKRLAEIRADCTATDEVS